MKDDVDGGFGAPGAAYRVKRPARGRSAGGPIRVLVGRTGLAVADGPGFLKEYPSLKELLRVHALRQGDLVAEEEEPEDETNTCVEVLAKPA